MNKDITLIDLSYFGLVKLSGENADTFLQGQLTSDIKTLTTDHFTFSAYCTSQGRVIANFILAKWQNEFLLQPLATMNMTLITHLQKYAVFSKVSIKDIAHRYHRLGVIGKDAKNTLEDLFGETPQNEWDVITLRDLMILNIPGKTLRYEVIACQSAFDKLKKACPNGVTTPETWQLIDIQSGFPYITTETTELYTPHDLNLPALSAVSFKKGCYVGQEIIARMEHLGKLKQHLYHAFLQSRERASVGEKIYDQSEKQIGTIINATQIEQNEYEVLAVLKDQALTEESMALERIQSKIVLL